LEEGEEHPNSTGGVRKIDMQTRPSSSVLWQRSRRRNSFDSLLLKAVDQALVNTVGESGATVIKFYTDFSIIVRSPEKFQQSLRKLFEGSEYAPRLLEEKIRRALADLLKDCVDPVQIRIEEWKEKSFRNFILACKRQFELSNQSP
jgi:hypothetical protein